MSAETLAIVNAPATQDPNAHKVHVWDLPIRIFHWGLVGAVATALITGKLGGNWMELHGKTGLLIIGLLTFRLCWGVLGSQTARFSQFVKGPASIRAYLRGQWQGLGHNPLGAVSVLALLGLLLIQTGLGLFGNDEISFTGPLISLVNDDFALTLTGLHRRLAFAIYGLLGLHIAAIVFYVWVRRHNIVKPMLTGQQAAPPGTKEPAQASWAALVISLALAGLAVWAGSGVWLSH